MSRRLVDSVRDALRDPLRRYLLLALVILGIVLVFVAHEAARRVPALPEGAPTVESLNVTKDRYEHCYLTEYSGGYKVGKGQKYDIECVVVDAGQALSYEWLVECKDPDTGTYESQCDGGNLCGEGSLVTWAAPDRAVDIRVTVTVSNMDGNAAAPESIALQVVSCSPCTFGSCG
ncbi:MAG: hypothetical protein ACLFVD_05350 [Dehalococcoidia bacterium]